VWENFTGAAAAREDPRRQRGLKRSSVFVLVFYRVEIADNINIAPKLCSS